MPVELTILAWSCVLLLVHIFAAAHVRTKQYGTKWNMGARDETLPPIDPLGGRLIRAQANFQETYPIAIIVLLGVVISGRANEWSAIGGWLWLGTRAVYLPLYGAGVPVVRTLVYLASMIGLGIAFKVLVAG
ncbi:MAG: MAPEG family protein [Sphingobium sp.]